ncbi:serine/threonine-protein phosphatase 1 regulatory subunit 10-like [Asbolus verrucosus]|uniref:Serine/threonine-protein phosphatase 1 regulatory subunit 10-like n=1 Tax=Asbolus verrucosus TaxID=1661398 RepID=A0A482VVI4_ASBVE|nr:serine/threonine-protein phosphatase 1 regulatory subunit 10-like [Asbolus verrucosus]
MPRIDPLQLLKCLSVLLSPEGGILSQDEVPRLVNLMTKFSKKLVSKCVYVLILKNTERSLVNLFMAEGGWNLIHIWLQDAIHISNWDLVTEILSLLLSTPVDVERLKLNNIPKLVKSLSRLDEVKGVQELSTQLVHDWLVIVKGNTKIDEVARVQSVEVKTEADIKTESPEEVPLNQNSNDTVDSSQIKPEEALASNDAITTNTFYKVTVRDGKQVISRAASVESSELPTEAVSIITPDADIKKESKEKKDDDKSNKSSDKSKSKSRSSSKHSSSSSSSRSKSSSSSRDKHKSSSSKSSSSSSRDKDRDRDRKDKHKANGAKSSSKDKGDSKEKQAEKDKDTLAKIKPQSIDKLGRIPKKTDDKAKEIKKPTMSIEVRKNSEDRPKTVKVFNSKRRSTGLEEEAKPPPPRPTKKAPVVLPTIPQKRPSPVRDLPAPPEKKLKVEIPERPGAIKLIPPKPKPPVLQESDIFMDALTASATTKKEPKKRKRRPSVSKDVPESPTTQEPQTPSSPVTSPIGLRNIAAPNFYQDTLETEQISEEKEESKEENVERSGTPIENEMERPKTEGGLKGALVYTKKKGPKKSVKFNDNNLTQIRYFELDETERVNVTKNFMDMAKMEMTSEREALQLSRKLPNEDVMEPQTMWRLPYLIDQNDPLAVPGCKSLEKDIQFAREKSVLQALYFDKRKIPDSADEPIPENHQISDPIIIPLEDAESQEMDLRNTPWPEPKGSPPPMQDNLPPQIFSNMPMPFQNFAHGAPPSFQGMPPRFGPQGGPGVFGGPPNILPNGNMMGPPNMGPPPEVMHQSHLNPNAFGPGPDNFNPMMNDNNFQMPFNPPNMGMFPPNNFNMNRGGGRGGGYRRGGNNNGPWIRMNGPGNWNRGGGGGRGRLCKNVKNHGFCRNMDKCPFIHPK